MKSFRKFISLFFVLAIICATLFVTQTSAFAAAPDTLILSGPSTVTVNTTSTIEFEANQQPSNFQCSIDEGPFTACTSPYTTPNQIPGQHSFAVKATNLSSETDSTPASVTWTINTIDQGDGSPAHPYRRRRPA